MTSTLCRSLATRGFAAIYFAALAVAAQAQQPRGGACVQLETQLAALDRGPADPARADAVRRFEDAAQRQQVELDRTLAQSRQAGCDGGGFFLFGGQPAACGPLNQRIQMQRTNLERVQQELARVQGGTGPEREGQRRALMQMLAQNDCGPQYRTAAAQPPQRGGGLFEALFGPGSVFSGGGAPGAPGAGDPNAGYKTVCVRTCDGYYYPISYATSQARFREDEKVCQASCPAAEAVLYTHRNPGEDMNQAVSLEGQPYTALPAAFKYRQAFDSACSCRKPGESWAQTVKQGQDPTYERGDLVVNDERAKQMSQPRVDAQGRPVRPDPRNALPPNPRAARPAAAAAPADGATQEGSTQPDPNRKVRAVGPAFIPSH